MESKFSKQNFFQKTNQWICCSILISSQDRKINSLVRILEEVLAGKFVFNFYWPLTHAMFIVIQKEFYPILYRGGDETNRPHCKLKVTPCGHNKNVGNFPFDSNQVKLHWNSTWFAKNVIKECRLYLYVLCQCRLYLYYVFSNASTSEWLTWKHQLFLCLGLISTFLQVNKMVFSRIIPK